MQHLHRKTFGRFVLVLWCGKKTLGFTTWYVPSTLVTLTESYYLSSPVLTALRALTRLILTATVGGRYQDYSSSQVRRTLEHSKAQKLSQSAMSGDGRSTLELAPSGPSLSPPWTHVPARASANSGAHLRTPRDCLGKESRGRRSILLSRCPGSNHPLSQENNKVLSSLIC